jgi:arylsulfatase A-like enzyme
MFICFFYLYFFRWNSFSAVAFLSSRYFRQISGLSQCQSGPPVIVYASGKAGLPSEEVTWPKMLQAYGYRTAAVGTNPMKSPRANSKRCLAETLRLRDM